MPRERTQGLTLTKPEKEQIVKRLREVLRAHPSVAFAFVFGSFVEEGPFHDLDVAVYLDEAVEDPWDTLLDLWEAFASQVDLPLDVCLLNEAPLALRYGATCGRLIYARDDEAEERAYRFIERTWDEFFDFQPVMRRYIEELAHAYTPPSTNEENENEEESP